MANHLSFAWRDALFTGDLVMGWSTSLVSPPDGDMTAFLESLERLQGRGEKIYFPGHGDPVAEPQARLHALIAHRRNREAQILATLRARGEATADQLAAAIYTDTPPALLPAATRNVLAHLIDLAFKNRVTVEEPLRQTARFHAM
jgi:glyoxylase-like metal-dependent hydrolase (beta-lactamase superfamily II)